MTKAAETISAAFAFPVLWSGALRVVQSFLLKPFLHDLIAGMDADDLQAAITDVREFVRDIGNVDDEIVSLGARAFLSHGELGFALADIPCRDAHAGRTLP